MKYILILLLTFSILTSGCNNKINITLSYIEFSKKPEYLNGFSFSRIIALDTKNPPSKYSEIKGERYCFLTDSTFSLSNKIYFDRPQRGLKWVKVDGAEQYEIIGKLKKNQWYIFKTLHEFNYMIFVYFDNRGMSNIYIDNKVNW